MDLFGENNKGAEFSEDGQYRYKLWRIWNSSLPKAMVIGLNPSTANADKNDNTINVLIRMLTQLGYGGFYMMNCFPFISTDPKKLVICNEETKEFKINNNWLWDTSYKCSEIIFAWGNFEIVSETGRDKTLCKMFPNAKCFGKNANGSPFHPRAMSYKGKLNSPELFLYTPNKKVSLNCMVCNKEFQGEEPKMCCSGKDCGCMGMPIEPIVCSDECYHNLPCFKQQQDN